MICKRCSGSNRDLTWIQNEDNGFHGYVCNQCLDDLMFGHEPNTTYYHFRTIKKYSADEKQATS